MGKTVTCLNCHNTGHKKRICKKNVARSQASGVVGTHASSVGGSQASASNTQRLNAIGKSKI